MGVCYMLLHLEYLETKFKEHLVALIQNIKLSIGKMMHQRVEVEKSLKNRIMMNMVINMIQQKLK